MDDLNNIWHWSTGIASSVLAHAVAEASPIVWSDEVKPLDQVLTPDGILRNDEVKWRPTKSFRGTNGVVSHAIVRFSRFYTAFVTC